MKTIDVSFYNEAHKKLLQKTPKYKHITNLTKSGHTYDEDLFIYCLFKEQKDRDGFRSYDDFKNRLPRRIGLFEDYIDFDSNTITSIDEHHDKLITEYIGVGVALHLISHIHSLTEADWEIIPETQTKDLDFEIGFDASPYT